MLEVLSARKFQTPFLGKPFRCVEPSEGTSMSSESRRAFLTRTAGLGLTGLGLAQAGSAAAGEEKLAVKFRLGIVTYNIAAQWDLPTILKVCKSVGLSPVELRTSHKHGVEPGLSRDQRREVRRRFADAGVDIWGCGTTCEFHSPD